MLLLRKLSTMMGQFFFAVSTEGTGGWNGLEWKVCATKPTKLRSVDAVLFVIFVVIISYDNSSVLELQRALILSLEAYVHSFV